MSLQASIREIGEQGEIIIHSNLNFKSVEDLSVLISTKVSSVDIKYGLLHRFEEGIEVSRGYVKLIGTPDIILEMSIRITKMVLSEFVDTEDDLEFLFIVPTPIPDLD